MTTEQEYHNSITKINDLKRQLNICEETQIDELAYELIAENKKLERIMKELDPNRLDNKNSLTEWHKSMVEV